jgi:hypothetical protein
MAANSPEIAILDDQDHQVVVKIVGYFTAATTSNTILQANTFKGANTSISPCLLSLVNFLYTTSMANGTVSLEWVGSSNVRAVSAGHFNDGEINKYIPNNATTPTGDLSIRIDNASPNDSFTIVATLLKEFQGTYWSGNKGAGAWANTQIGY